MITRIAASIFVLAFSCVVFVYAANDDGEETKDETIERLENELADEKELGKQKDETIPRARSLIGEPSNQDDIDENRKNHDKKEEAKEVIVTTISPTAGAAYKAGKVVVKAIYGQCEGYCRRYGYKPYENDAPVEPVTFGGRAPLAIPNHFTENVAQMERSGRPLMGA